MCRTVLLPTRKELAYILNDGVTGTTITTRYFTNTAASWYWSSTTYVSDTNGAWLVNFIYGYVNYFYKYYAGYVRAVRGGQ